MRTSKRWMVALRDSAVLLMWAFVNVILAGGCLVGFLLLLKGATKLIQN